MAQTEARQAWMGLLARNGASAAALLARAGISAAHTPVRSPEIGTVMVRGRAGATAGAFNLGEITVTRCSVRLDCGRIGHGYVQGRDGSAAQAAALIDALMQTGEASRIEARVLAPLRASETAARQGRRAKAAATKVDFFTMVRGESP